MSVQVTVDSARTPASTRTVADVLDFAEAPPGLRDLRQFQLSPLDETGFLFALRSTQDPEVRLFVVPPQAYFPDYAPRFDDGARALLGLEDEAVLLVVVHPGLDGQAPTANLLAPVAVNPVTGAAVQLVLDDDRWPLRAPLTAAGSAA